MIGNDVTWVDLFIQLLQLCKDLKPSFNVFLIYRHHKDGINDKKVRKNERLETTDRFDGDRR